MGTSGPVQYDSAALEKDRSELVRVNLAMGAGSLKVGSGTQKLLQAYFTYNVPSFKPEVVYTPSGGTADLTVRQPSGNHAHFGNTKNEWDLRFNQDVPLEITTNFGAGDAQLDLGSLALRSVSVQMGVGQLQMDLRGNPKHDYAVDIHGGVGEATVRLPSNVGLYLEAAGGIGAVDVKGLRKENGHWVNDAYAQPGVKVRVDVHGGIGEIKVIAE
jgi:predicted membrane protein